MKTILRVYMKIFARNFANFFEAFASFDKSYLFYQILANTFLNIFFSWILEFYFSAESPPPYPPADLRKRKTRKPMFTAFVIQKSFFNLSSHFVLIHLSLFLLRNQFKRRLMGRGALYCGLKDKTAFKDDDVRKEKKFISLASCLFIVFSWLFQQQLSLIPLSCPLSLLVSFSFYFM